jgi:hypothetical protein
MHRGRGFLPRSAAKPLVSVVVRSLAAFGFIASFAGAAAASPQGHVAYRTSVCGVGTNSLWQDTRWCNGFVADLLLLRERNGDFGLGPYAEISTAGFWDARYGGGASALLPVAPDFPLVLSLGAYGHESDSVALGANAFFGLRSYNFHGSYNYAVGFVVSGYKDLGADRATLVTLGIELDGLLLALPFLFVAGELR